MKPVEDGDAAIARSHAPRRAWAVPRARRLATSDAENSTGIGPDSETFVS